MNDDFSTGRSLPDSEEEYYLNDSENETDDSISPIAKKKTNKCDVLYDSEESEDEVTTINVQQQYNIFRNTRVSSKA